MVAREEVRARGVREWQGVVINVDYEGLLFTVAQVVSPWAVSKV